MMYQTDNRQPVEVARLEDYLQAFRQRKWLVLSCLALGIVLAFLYTESRATSFTATAEVEVGTTPVGSTNNNDVAPRLEQESRVVASDRVAAEVQAAFPTANRENLDVKFTPNSQILVISYTAATAQEAAAIAGEFASVYAAQRTAEAVAFYQTNITANQEILTDVNAELAAEEEVKRQVVAERDALLREAPSEARAAQLEQKALEISQVSGTIDTLKREVTSINAAIRSDDTEIRTLAGSPPAEVLASAAVPGAPDGIPRSLLLAAGGLLGLVLGLVAAFFLERIDTTARDEDDVALALGTSVIGAIPALGMGRLRPSQSLIMFSTGGSAKVAAAREAFRRLRSSLLFLNSSSGVSSAVVTSSAPGEGKSVTSANLAIALAQNGSRVVLVSADMRRPTLEGMFGMDAQRPGLAEYLGQTAELNADKVPGIENLWLIRSGRPPANPSELLNSDRFELLIKELEREDVEYIIVDSPPVLSTADAMSAARYVDGVIVVVDAEQTDTADLLQVRADLERSGAKLLGAVLNRRKLDGGGLFRRSKYAYYQTAANQAE
ncbi:MAG: polysaccharide biosynthesis tyrosine autokinase [Actinomycetota bacterium]